MIWKTARHTFDLTQRGLIMGVLNVTPDSFSDGGRFMAREKAVARAMEMEAEGAHIIDIGGESTRPGAMAVPAEEETRRVLPVVRAVREQTRCAISVDTMKAVVATAALEAGADIINDVSGLNADPLMAAAVARAGAGLVLMHMQGTPESMQRAPAYDDVVREIQASLHRSMEIAAAAGVALECLALDPGIGFGKSLEHNLTILQNPAAFALDRRPVLLGVSRKSFIGRILGPGEPDSRRWPTVALTSLARERGARIFRVHDVRENVQALRMTEAVLHG